MGSQKSINKKTNDVLDTAEEFIWGINGHPVTSKDYMSVSIDDQLLLLQQYQMSDYRFDVRLDPEGNVTWYKSEFNELLRKSEEYQIELLPVILFNLFLDDYQISEAEAYRRGEIQMKGFVSKYGKNFKVYNLGNEQDLRILKEGRTGESPSDYDLEKFKIVAAYFKGMISGIKQVDPKAKTLINSSNSLYFGYFQLLEDYQVDYDILGYHWYSLTDGSDKIMKEALVSLTRQFIKPIWITEINRRHGSFKDYNNSQSHLIGSYLHSIRLIPEIQALFIYELLDQPSLAGENLDFEQSQYGLYQLEGGGILSKKKIRSKQFAELLKIDIEEAKNSSQNYVYSISQKLLEKTPSGNELLYWTSKIKNTRSIEYFLDVFLKEHGLSLTNKNLQNLSRDERKLAVNEKTNLVYQKYLSRLPTVNEIKFWERKLSKKSIRMNIIKTLLLSEEFWENAMRSGYERNAGFKLNSVH
ncbi:MAG TPA: glycosyl hydrolase 53 family protein [Moheibacter sp.]|nr:glycosyl hydrolase 53 family protein [Moheibacter sp.]